MHKISPMVERVLYTQEQLETRIAQLAELINRDYKKSKDLILVGLMKGSLPFMMQLIKFVDIDCRLDFLTVSSYNGKTHSSGSAKIILDMAQDIENKDVLIIEEIIDSGITLARVKELLSSRKPNSLKIMTLLDKKANRINDLEPDYSGFECEDEFVVGFGLDYDEKLRNLPYIGVFNKKYLD